jgi:hypothetical protein
MMFTYGAQNASLSHFAHTEAQGVRRSEIPRCGRSPMCSNPTAMWCETADFIGEG